MYFIFGDLPLHFLEKKTKCAPGLFGLCITDWVLSPIPREDTADIDTAAEADGGAAGVAHVGFRDAFVSVSQSHPAGEVWVGQTGCCRAANSSTPGLERQQLPD